MRRETVPVWTEPDGYIRENGYDWRASYCRDCETLTQHREMYEEDGDLLCGGCLSDREEAVEVEEDQEESVDVRKVLHPVYGDVVAFYDEVDSSRVEESSVFEIGSLTVEGEPVVWFYHNASNTDEWLVEVLGEVYSGESVYALFDIAEEHSASVSESMGGVVSEFA